MLADILRSEHKIEIERVYNDYVIAMTSICDSPEGFARLADALCAIDARQYVGEISVGDAPLRVPRIAL
jgi:hypothetical protein